MSEMLYLFVRDTKTRALAYEPSIDPCISCGSWKWTLTSIEMCEANTLACGECNATRPLLVGRD